MLIFLIVILQKGPDKNMNVTCLEKELKFLKDNLSITNFELFSTNKKNNIRKIFKLKYIITQLNKTIVYIFIIWDKSFVNGTN